MPASNAPLFLLPDPRGGRIADRPRRLSIERETLPRFRYARVRMHAPSFPGQGVVYHFHEERRPGEVVEVPTTLEVKAGVEYLVGHEFACSLAGHDRATILEEIP